MIEGGILWTHIVAGWTALLGGCAALFTRKGSLRHRQAGRVFVASMGVIVASVFLLVAVDPTPFRVILTLVAVFSGYFAFSGYRVLSRKRPAAAARTVDWAAAGCVVLTCLGLGVWGVTWVIDGRSFGGVMTVFGGIGLWFGLTDVRAFITGSAGEWMITHLQRMIAAFIATVSAVSAVNLTPTLGVLAWLWPTVVGVPLIIYWSKRYGTA